MIWVWVGIAVVLVAAGALVPVLSGRRSARLSSNDEAVAARSRYNQLGFYVENLEQLDDDKAMTLMRTALERYNTAGATLARARTEDDFLLAMGVAEEGLQAVADAYALIGRAAPRFKKQKRHN